MPPDLFSKTGQLWGNPTYRWTALRRDGYRWWIERFRRSLELFDLARLDHFRGFVAYWAVRYGNRTARSGRWLRGPGRALFDAVTAELGPLPLIAEDLGVITLPVRRLRQELDLPGMHILQWAFGVRNVHPEKLANHREYAVVYSGTHDNDTTEGWWEWAPDRVRARVVAECEKAGIDPADPSWGLIELALSCRARLGIVQAPITIREAPGDGGSLLALMENCDVLLLVVAVAAAAEPGTIHRGDGSHERVSRTAFPTSTHGVGVAEAVETARVLGKLPETVVLYGIEASSFEPGNGLSEPVLKSVPELIGILEEDISRLSNPEEHPHHA